MRVAIALGSGGARGFAHIGVLQVLTERGHEISAVAGTSAGALVGGLFAAGALDEFTEWVTALGQRELLGLLDPALGRPGVLEARRVLDRIAGMLDDARIEELPIPFVAVATDLIAQREVWFDHGPVAAAIRASIALPTIITPVQLHGRVLADGGLTNPVPVNALVAASADVTVAVDLNAPATGRLGGRPARESGDDVAQSPGWLEALLRAASGAAAQLPNPLAGRRDGLDALGFEELPRDLRTADVLTMSLNASQALVTRLRTAANPPDVWVHVPADSGGTLEFLRAGEMVALGRELAAESFDQAGL